MITITLMIFSILGGIFRGVFKLILITLGVAFELFLIQIIINCVGTFGFGIFLLVDLVFLFAKITRR